MPTRAKASSAPQRSRINPLLPILNNWTAPEGPQVTLEEVEWQYPQVEVEERVEEAEETEEHGHLSRRHVQVGSEDFEWTLVKIDSYLVRKLFVGS